MDTKPEPTVRDHAKTARTIADAIQEIVCTAQRRDSCITRERKRPLTRAEWQRGWRRRPFYAFDPARLCRVCQAYLFATCLRNVLDDMARNEVERPAAEALAPTGT